MVPGKTTFDNVTLLITHFNRSNSLKRLLSAFHDLNCSFAAIVVSDDSSQAVHFQALKSLQRQYNFQLVTSTSNRGLANNLNKGQDAVQTPYTLYIQEDFVPQPSFVPKLQESVAFMQQDNTLDIVRFYAYFMYPYLRPFKSGFSEMVFSPWAANYNKIYCYSDHPHLRRSTFLDKFGRYVEGIKGDRAEYRMCISFLQKKGKALFYNDYESLLIQENDAQEPSTMKRAEWTQHQNPFVIIVRYIYRQIRYNYDIRFLT